MFEILASTWLFLSFITSFLLLIVLVYEADSIQWMSEWLYVLLATWLGLTCIIDISVLFHLWL